MSSDFWQVLSLPAQEDLFSDNLSLEGRGPLPFLLLLDFLKNFSLGFFRVLQGAAKEVGKRSSITFLSGVRKRVVSKRVVL